MLDAIVSRPDLIIIILTIAFCCKALVRFSRDQRKVDKIICGEKEREKLLNDIHAKKVALAQFDNMIPWPWFRKKVEVATQNLDLLYDTVNELGSPNHDTVMPGIRYILIQEWKKWKDFQEPVRNLWKAFGSCQRHRDNLYQRQATLLDTAEYRNISQCQENWFTLEGIWKEINQSCRESQESITLVRLTQFDEALKKHEEMLHKLENQYDIK